MNRLPDVLVWLDDTESDLPRSVEYHRADNTAHVSVNGSPVVDLTPDLMAAINEAAVLVAENRPTNPPPPVGQPEADPYASPFTRPV